MFCGALQYSEERVGAPGLHAALPQRTRRHRPPGTHLCPRSVTSPTQTYKKSLKFQLSLHTAFSAELTGDRTHIYDR